MSHANRPTMLIRGPLPTDAEVRAQATLLVKYKKPPAIVRIRKNGAGFEQQVGSAFASFHEDLLKPYDELGFETVYLGRDRAPKEEKMDKEGAVYAHQAPPGIKPQDLVAPDGHRLDTAGAYCRLIDLVSGEQIHPKALFARDMWVLIETMKHQ